VGNSGCVVCHREYGNTYRQSNRETIRAKHRIYQSQYQKDNPEVKRKAQSLRRARLRNCEGVFTTKEISELYSKQDGKCSICLCDISTKYEIDHKTPLSRGGSNWISNIQLLCPGDNKRKNSRTDEEYRLILKTAVR
jgi:5-methylcytosine-specific restriction endonuclease McrA